MRAVLQRVTAASVSVEGECVARIGEGVVALVGLRSGDSAGAAERLLNRLVTLRLWPSGAGGKPWSESLSSLPRHKLLLVSQFTLHASVAKAKPSFHMALGTEEARAAFEELVRAARARLGAERVETGVFGAMMSVSLTNDGPVTIVVDTDDFSGAKLCGGSAATGDEGEGGSDEVGTRGDATEGGGGAAAASVATAAAGAGAGASAADTASGR